MNWYALFVETGRETLIQKWIQYFFDQSVCYSLVPKRILTETKQGQKYQIVRTMFPGYVFINTDMCIEYYYKLKEIPRILRILSNGTYYSEINEYEMSPILKLTGNSDVINYSQVFAKNSKVFVKSGPLYGMEGMIRKIDKRHGRAQIMLEFMGSPKLIDVGIQILTTMD